jgi:hypothetical protein
MDVVLDHHLHADFHMPGAGENEEKQDDRDRRRAQDLGGTSLVTADKHQYDHDDGHDQQGGCDGGQALTPEIGSAGMRRAEIADPPERRAHGSRARGSIGPAHRPPPTV